MARPRAQPSPGSSRLLVVRADATPEIGSGHLLRCLALAQAWQYAGGRAAFVGRCDDAGLKRRIEKSGFEWIGRPPEDLRQFLDLLAARQPAWTTMDGPRFRAAEHKGVRAAGHRLLVIDDHAPLAHYHANVLLNVGLGEPKYTTDPDTVLLIGPQYALLRREFLQRQGGRPEIPERARNILVTMGGSDADNATLKVLQAVAPLTGFNVRVLVGALNPHRERLEEEARQAAGRVQILGAVSDMAPLMEWAELAVTAAGSTCWELAYCGVPSAVLVLAQHQKSLAAGLEREGVAIDLGWHHETTTAEIGRALDALGESQERRVEMSEKGRALVDGRGGQRVLIILESLVKG